jgi:uncharacterized protein YkwD
MRRLALLVASLLTIPCWAPRPAAAEERGEPWPMRFGGDDPAVPLDALEREALEILREAMAENAAPPCRPSATLVAAARAHAHQLLSTPASRGRVDVRLVRLEVLRAGGVDPVVIPWAEAFPLPRPEPASPATPAGRVDLRTRRDRLAARYGERPPTHCGVGVAASATRQVLVVIGVRRHVALEPVPATAARGDQVRLDGQLASGYHSPSVLVTTPTGEVVESQTLRRSGRFGAWLSFTLPGQYAVEVMATGPQGPEIVALFPVYVDTTPQGRAGSPGEGEAGGQLQASQGVEGTATPESLLLRLLDQERHRAGLDPLELDPELSRLAADHSADMARRGYFGHVSPSGLDLTARLREAGVTTRRAAENLVRSTGAQRAHAQLMESPSHRANLLDPDLTHVGIGVAEGDGELLVTQIYVAW